MNLAGHSGHPRRPSGFFATLALCGLSLHLGGCAIFGPGPPPPPPPVSRARVASAVRRHAATFRTVTDTDISLRITQTVEGERDRMPTLGGFVAFDKGPPGLWLDTEKISRRIFSLKALGSRFWLALFDTRELVVGGPLAYSKLPHLIQPAEVKGFFAGPEWLGLTWEETGMEVLEETYRFDVRTLGVLRRRVSVDRRNLVVTRIRDYEALGRVGTDVRLREYELSGDRLFPRRLTVDRPRDGVTIDLWLDDPKLNKELPPKSFQPVERPGWRVIDLDRQPLSAVEAFSGEE